MANTNQTTTGIADMLGKLSTFLTGLGWVEDEAVGSDRWAIHKTDNGNSLYNQFRWENGDENILGIYQSTGWSMSTDPGNHPGDSGMGEIGSTNEDLDDGRHVRVGTSPIQFWAYADATNDYCHVVVQETTTRFVHFGFGVLNKFGDWTGGEYTYGQYDNTRSVQSGGNMRGDFLSYLLDGRATYHNNVTVGSVVEPALLDSLPTLRVDAAAFPGGAVSDWAVVAGVRHPFINDVGDDRAGDQRSRCFGALRDGSTATPFGRFNGRSVDGIVPMTQMPIFYTNGTTGLGSQHFYLGEMRDVRGINIAFFEPADIITIGGEDWQVFPLEPKGSTKGSYGGVAYRVF